MQPGLRARLRELAARPPGARLANDPLGLVRPAADREGAALIAALLAFGQVAGIRRAVARALAAADGDRAALRGFRHRWIGEPELRRLLRGMADARARHGSLEGLFAAHDDGDLAAALDGFCTALRGPRPSRALRWLLPRPRDGSACKRPLLFLRWVVRPDDGADLGLWGVDPARLVVPLDTHVHRISYWLGLTDRKTANWKTALAVTDALRAIDPRDPVRFDFALAHLGIAKDCPRRPDAVTCRPCPLRAHCRVWTATNRCRPCGPPRTRPSSSPPTCS